MNPNTKVQEKKAVQVQVMARLEQRLAVVCLGATLFLSSGCATKMAVAPKIQNAQTASDFRLYGHIQYDGNRDYLPRTLVESNDTNAPLILEYTCNVVYGRDKTPQAIPLFNRVTIVGFPIGENTLVVSTRLTVSKGKEPLKEYISTCGMQGARSVFSEGDTFSEMRRKGLIATRDNIEQQLLQDREWLSGVSALRCGVAVQNRRKNMKVKMQIQNAVVSLLLATGAMWVGGCASVGPSYQRVEKIPDGMGVVYLYRPSHLVAGGVTYKVRAGDTPIVTMYNGGYYPYFTKPGEVELTAKTESTSSVTVDVKLAQSQYVKCTVGVGFFIGRPHLMVVSPEQAEAEIVKCRLLTAKP